MHQKCLLLAPNNFKKLKFYLSATKLLITKAICQSLQETQEAYENTVVKIQAAQKKLKGVDLVKIAEVVIVYMSTNTTAPTRT